MSRILHQGYATDSPIGDPSDKYSSNLPIDSSFKALIAFGAFDEKLILTCKRTFRVNDMMM